MDDLSSPIAILHQETYSGTPKDPIQAKLSFHLILGKSLKLQRFYGGVNVLVWFGARFQAAKLQIYAGVGGDPMGASPPPLSVTTEQLEELPGRVWPDAG